jgi:Domain of unknown function (DUF5658)
MHGGHLRSFRTGLIRALSPECRATRVTALLIGIVLLSLGDLYMTLLHLVNFGMLEQNPLAREIMAHNSPAALVVWKLITVGLAVGILFWARRRPAAELAALFCCGVLTWLTLRWSSYSEQMADLTHGLTSMTQEDEPHWVTMAPGD